MKKTLFAVAALALCGTAVAETKTYDAIDWQGEDFDETVYGAKNDVVFKVNQTVTLTSFTVYSASSATLNFIGENTFSTSFQLDLGVDEEHGTLAITGDPTAKTHWGESLTSSAGGVTTLTLASGNAGVFYAPVSASFEGLTESGSITLGGAALTYMGFYAVDTVAEAEALIRGDNQIALVAIDATRQLALVGKATATTPEPATATLSLMALAGLASRRRRH